MVKYMVVFFIEETERFKLLKKIVLNQDRIIINRRIDKINNKIKHKILKILDNNSCNNVIISKKLKNNSNFINFLYSNNINIVNGRKLLGVLIEKIIEKGCKDNELIPKESIISFAINYSDANIIKTIENCSKRFKFVNIVSNNMYAFKKIKEKLYNENGIIITVTNNRKKALLKTDIIVNMDFPEEMLNKYAIYDNAVVINIDEPTKIRKKRFSGKIINDCKISFKKKSNIELELKQEKYKKFDIKDLAEVYLIKYPEEICNLVI